MDTAEQLRGVLWAFGGALLTAVFMVPWRLAGAHGEGADMVLVMLSAAAVVNTFGALWQLRSAPPAHPLAPTRTVLWLAAGMALLTLAGNQASAAAIQRIDGPLLALLQRAEVLVVAAGAWLALGERVDSPFIAGTALAGVGLWLITGVDLDLGVDHAQGVLFGIASAVAFGSMNVLVRAHAVAIRPVVVNAARLWLAVLLWFAMQRRLPDVAGYDPRMVGYAVLAALAGPVCARLSIMLALRHIEARMVALVLLSTPVLTLGTSYVFLDELPAQRSLLGGAIMLCGIAIPVVRRVVQPAPAL